MSSGRSRTAGIRARSGCCRISARSAAEAAAALGVDQRQIVKSLVFRGARSGAPVLALVGGASRVDAALLEAHIGEPIERADAGWVRERTGFAIGGIPPLGHSEPLRTVADAQLAALDELWAAAGTPHAVFPLHGAQLASLTGAELAAIAVPEAASCAAERPAGPKVDWSPVPPPPRTPMPGAHVVLRPVQPDDDADALHAISHAPHGDPAIWTYLPDGPFETAQAMRDALADWARLDDPLRFTIIGGPADSPLGMASFMRMVPAFGVIEIGHIWFGAALQRTTGGDRGDLPARTARVRRARLPPARMEVRRAERRLASRGGALRLHVRGHLPQAHDHQGPQPRHRLVRDHRRRVAGDLAGLPGLAGG